MVLRLFFIAFLWLLGCGSLEFDNPTDPYNISHPSGIAYKSFTDKRDGKSYKSVAIGTQTWMAENLNYRASGSYCISNVERDGVIKDTLVSDGGYCDLYGRLYNWETAMSICPAGWHLPNSAEWNMLTGALGGDFWTAITKLKSKSGWRGGDNGDNGTDDYGFTALPGYSIWWSSSESSSEDYATVFGTSGGVGLNKESLLSIRCIEGDIPYSTVTFNANGATSGSAPASISVIPGNNAQIPGNGSLLRTGYVFNGWNTSTSGTTIPEHEANSSFAVASDITLYANWLPIRTVTFDGNNATSGIPPSNMTAGSGLSITLPQQGTLQKEGELFVGWNPSSSGTGTNYKAGSSYAVADNTTLYAIFGEPCTITFVASGASNVPQSITAGSGAIIELPTVSRSGYIFNGWTSSGTGTEYAGSVSYTVAGDDTLSAIWKTPAGAIIVKNTLSSTISAIDVWGTIGGTSYSKNYQVSVKTNGSYTISGLSAGTYGVAVYYYANGGSLTTKSKTGIIVNENTVTVTF